MDQEQAIDSLQPRQLELSVMPSDERLRWYLNQSCGNYRRRERPTCSDLVVQRSRIILLAFDQHNNQAIEQRLGISYDAVGKSRRRRRDAWGKLAVLECNSTPQNSKLPSASCSPTLPAAGRNAKSPTSNRLP